MVRYGGSSDAFHVRRIVCALSIIFLVHKMFKIVHEDENDEQPSSRIGLPGVFLLELLARYSECDQR